MTSTGWFAAASPLLNVATGFVLFVARRTSVTTFRPAAFSAWRKLVRSISYTPLVVPVTLNEPRIVVPALGLLFHGQPRHEREQRAVW